MVRDIRHGILGGLIGGLVFAGIMFINGTLANMGMLTLPLIGSLVGHPSAWVGLAVHMLNSAIIGAGYAVTLGRYEKGMIDGLHLGMMYGGIWWFLGPLTIMPMLLGEPVGSRWVLDEALDLFPSLIGHVVFGLIVGLTVGHRRDASLPVPTLAGDAGAAPETTTEEVVVADRAQYAEPPRPPSARPRGAKAPRAVPIWMSMTLIFVLFVLNVVIFGYAAISGGFPRRHESRPPPAAAVESGVAAPESAAAEGAAADSAAAAAESADESEHAAETPE